MDVVRRIFGTIDHLKAGAPDLFYSHEMIAENPDQTFSAWHVHAAKLSKHSEYKQIKKLYLQDCTKLLSLDWLESVPNLEELWVYGSNKLENIEGVQFAENLKSLTIWPSFNADITLDNLAPVAALAQLEELNFSGKTRDNSLSHLSHCGSLRNVFFSNSYPWVEVARFEASHPDIEFPWKGGVVYDANPTVLTCKKCGLPQAMLTGKGLRLSCPECDGKYLQKHIERYRKVAVA